MQQLCGNLPAAQASWSLRCSPLCRWQKSENRKKQMQEIVLPVAFQIRSRLGFELFHLSVRLLRSFSFQLLFESPTRGERRKEKNPSADRSAVDSGRMEHWRIPAFEGQTKSFLGPYRKLRILHEWADVHAIWIAAEITTVDLRRFQS